MSTGVAEMHAADIHAEPVDPRIEAIAGPDWMARNALDVLKISIDVLCRRGVFEVGTRLPAQKLTATRLREAVRKAMTMTDGAPRRGSRFAATGRRSARSNVGRATRTAARH